MKRRIIGLILLACMLLVMVVGCGKQEETGADDNTLTVGLPMSADVTDYENNILTKYVEEQLGIKLKFQLFSSV